MRESTLHVTFNGSHHLIHISPCSAGKNIFNSFRNKPEFSVAISKKLKIPNSEAADKPWDQNTAEEEKPSQQPSEGAQAVPILWPLISTCYPPVTPLTHIQEMLHNLLQTSRAKFKIHRDLYTLYLHLCEAVSLLGKLGADKHRYVHCNSRAFLLYHLRRFWTPDA